MDTEQNYSIDDEGYFGITQLDMSPYSAQLMANRVKESQAHGIKLHFDEAYADYSADKQALTIEGYALSVSTPEFAIESLEAYASLARDMDKLMKPYAS